MAAIHDLITQVEDEILRSRLAEELSHLTKEKTFGLVFETHLPELTLLYAARVVRGATVARRKGPITDLWRVLSVAKDHAECIHRASGQRQEMDVTELVVVRQFGEPIFPSLVPVDRVVNGPEDGPWHTLIEADNYHALQLLEYLGEKARRQIDEGVIQIVGRDEQSGAVEVEYIESQQSNVKTVWHRRAHDSGNYGSSVLRAIIGRDVKV